MELNKELLNNLHLKIQELLFQKAPFSEVSQTFKEMVII